MKTTGLHLSVFDYLEQFSRILRIVNMLRTACQMWQRPARDSLFDMHKFSLGVFYLDRALFGAPGVGSFFFGIYIINDFFAEGVKCPCRKQGKETAEMATTSWTVTAASLAHKVACDASMRYEDRSFQFFVHAAGGTAKLNLQDHEEHLFTTRLSQDAYRVTVYSYLSLWKPRLLGDAWTAALYLATSALFLEDLGGRMLPSRLAIAVCRMAHRLSFDAGDEVLDAASASILGDQGQAGKVLFEVANTWLTRRPSFAILLRLFPLHAKIPAQDYLDKWETLWASAESN
jgi:hypothetical protein